MWLYRVLEFVSCFLITGFTHDIHNVMLLSVVLLVMLYIYANMNFVVLCHRIILALQFEQEDVDLDTNDLEMYDYPPRYIFDISPDKKAEPCTLQLRLTKMSEDITFQIKLDDKQHSLGYN